MVCYGLGDGSNASRLAEGLHRYQPMRLILADDASGKHAGTQAWVRQVAKVVQPSSLVSVITRRRLVSWRPQGVA